MSDREWQRVVIVCAGTRWDGMPSSEHHLADRLSRSRPVLYVDPPTSVATAFRVPGLEKVTTLRVIRPGLARLTPVVLPAMRRPGMSRITEALVRRRIRTALRRLGATAAVRILASDLPLYDLASQERRVLFATDDFIAGAELMGLPTGQMRSNQQRLGRESDVVVAVSEPMALKWRALGCQVVVIPNGCDAERFAATDTAPYPEDVRLPAPIAGYAGLLNDRLDVTLLEAVAARGRSVLLVGPATRTFDSRKLDALLRLPNVQWVGAKPFELMPSYLRAMHVGLTPYGDTDFNRASFPLKTVEYLAAGRAVVSMDLPSARSLATEHISLARNPREFADAVDVRLNEILTGAVVAERRAFAAVHSWSARAQQFADVIDTPVLRP